jgi:colanic acid/amylovoran biosynthesis glycosyltransferase
MLAPGLPAYRGAAMRIALLVDQFPELSETFIAAEAHELCRLGHDVRVESIRRAPHPNEAAAAGLEVVYRQDDDRARVLRDSAWLAARHPAAVVRDLRGRARWRREEPVEPLRRLAPAARRLHRFGAEHLHAHFAAGAALDAMRLAAVLGLPYSVMTHGYDIFQSPRNLAEKHARAAFAATACEYSARYLRKRLGLAAGEPQVIVVGVDGERFRRRTPHPAGGTVLAVGRLVEKKGFAHLIEAARLLADDPAFDRALIVGDGPLREELTALARGAPVELLGPRTPDEIRELLEEAAVVAVPCVVAADGDRDTMPVIAKEALAMEVPVVASDEVGLPEIVQPPWGRLVPPGDAGALADALRELLALPPERRAELGRAGREHVLAAASLSHETARLAGWVERARQARG